VVIILAYVAAITAIGLYAGRRPSSAAKRRAGSSRLPDRGPTCRSSGAPSIAPSPKKWLGARPRDTAPVLIRLRHRAMLSAMRGLTLERRAFVTLVGKALMGAGALVISRADPVPARDRDPNVFSGQETFEQLLRLARERAWSELPIGERIGAIGMALRQTPYVEATLELYEDREVCSVNLRGLDPRSPSPGIGTAG
jgi:hypothetical protein